MRPRKRLAMTLHLEERAEATTIHTKWFRTPAGIQPELLAVALLACLSRGKKVLDVAAAVEAVRAAASETTAVGDVACAGHLRVVHDEEGD